MFATKLCIHIKQDLKFRQWFKWFFFLATALILIWDTTDVSNVFVFDALLILSFLDRPKQLPLLFHCLTPDDFTCQGIASRRERVKG